MQNLWTFLFKCLIHCHACTIWCSTFQNVKENYSKRSTKMSVLPEKFGTVWMSVRRFSSEWRFGVCPSPHCPCNRDRPILSSHKYCHGLGESSSGSIFFDVYRFASNPILNSEKRLRCLFKIQRTAEFLTVFSRKSENIHPCLQVSGFSWVSPKWMFIRL